MNTHLLSCNGGPYTRHVLQPPTPLIDARRLLHLKSKTDSVVIGVGAAYTIQCIEEM